MRKFQSPAARARHRKAFLLKWELRVALVGTLLLLLTQVVDASFFRVRSVAVEGNKTISEKVVVSHTGEVLRGYYLNLFSRRNALLIPRGQIVEALQEAYPRIETVRTDLKGFKTLTIHITERGSVGVACPAEGGTCLYINEEGFMFAEAPRVSGDLFFRYTGEFENPENPVGTFLVSLEAFSDARALADALKNLGISLTGVTFYDSYFAFEIKGGGEIRINRIREEYSEALTNLSAVLEGETFRGEGGGLSFTGIQYIDLRFGSKVFFK